MMSITELVGLLISGLCCPEIEKRFYQVFICIVNVMIYFSALIVCLIYNEPISEMVLVLLAKVLVTI